ncbi:MAG: N-acetylmuramoyl-L-alanine amidase [Lachnospiraceae bacterium]|nr:N-acetylmuramoyl-L-alanine amidase [Lachnospiraceae bacterium]
MIKQIMTCSILLLCAVTAFSGYVKGVTPAEGSENTLPEGAGGTPSGESGESVATPAVVPTTVASFPITPEPIMSPTGLPEPSEQLVRVLPEAWSDIRGAETTAVYDYLTDKTIVLEKREGYENAVLTLEELPVLRQLRVTVSGVMGEPIREENVKRIAQDTCYSGTPPTPTPTATPVPTKAGEPTQGLKPGMQPTPTPTLSPEDPFYPWRNDLIRVISSEEEIMDDGALTQTLLLTLDRTYVYRVYEDEWNYYISLVRPKDVYSKIIVVDAGHGGNDAGTSSAGSVFLEKTVNLNIVLYLKELLDAHPDICVYYTRLNDTKPSLKQRVNLANDLEADFFLSVHCNANVAKSLHGTEVLYSSLQNGWTGMNSRRFALICLAEMNEQVGLFDRGIVARDHNVTIIRDAKMPVALVETAFMSNVSDMEILAQEQTQRNIAGALCSAVLKAYEELEEIGAGEPMPEEQGMPSGNPEASSGE